MVLLMLLAFATATNAESHLVECEVEVYDLLFGLTYKQCKPYTPVVCHDKHKECPRCDTCKQNSKWSFLPVELDFVISLFGSYVKSKGDSGDTCPPPSCGWLSYSGWGVVLLMAVVFAVAACMGCIRRPDVLTRPLKLLPSLPESQPVHPSSDDATNETATPVKDACDGLTANGTPCKRGPNCPGNHKNWQHPQNRQA